MVFRGVDSYSPRFTSSHGQNVVDSRGAAESTPQKTIVNVSLPQYLEVKASKHE